MWFDWTAKLNDSQIIDSTCAIDFPFNVECVGVCGYDLRVCVLC